MPTTFGYTTRQTLARFARNTTLGVVLVVLHSLPVAAQDAPTLGSNAADSPPAATRKSLSCTSMAGERADCKAVTTAGVSIVNSTGTAACVLGKTWGYNDTGIW